MAKNHFFGQKVKKNFGQPTTRNLELKMLKLNENHLKTNVYRRGFLIFLFIKILIMKFLTKKCQKSDFDKVHVSFTLSEDVSQIKEIRQHK